MTREEAIAMAPSTRRSYLWSIAFVVTMNTIYLWLAWRFPAVRNRVFLIIFALLAVASAALLLQTLERLFYPVRAAERSLRLANAENVLFIGKVLAWIIYGATILLLLLSLAKWHGLKPNMSGPLIFLQIAVMQFFRDLSGIKVVEEEQFEHSPPLTELKPIQSDEWGTPGSSRNLL